MEATAPIYLSHDTHRLPFKLANLIRQPRDETILLKLPSINTMTSVRFDSRLL